MSTTMMMMMTTLFVAHLKGLSATLVRRPQGHRQSEKDRVCPSNTPCPVRHVNHAFRSILTKRALQVHRKPKCPRRREARAGGWKTSLPFFLRWRPYGMRTDAFEAP
uniref:Secreted protein n=1 Tax=Ixodes ricinus TaxID=34613 RepID=A0A6B0UHS1_IXORI